MLELYFLVHGEKRKWAGLISAVLFAVHPVHTESVTGIVGRADTLCCIFYIFGFFCFVRSVSLWPLNSSGMKPIADRLNIYLMNSPKPSIAHWYWFLGEIYPNRRAKLYS